MTGYINRTQWAQLIAPIKSERVASKDGQSNVEAYDIRAHLNRVFGFARWSDDLLDLVMLYEQSKDDGGQTRWRSAYRATVRLTVNAPDGTQLATYTAAAVGTNFGWLPDSKRDDAHDMAIKTASSQALKRCAIDLGDQFGLSLYNKGSISPLVFGTIIVPDPVAPAAAGTHPDAPHQDVTAHIIEQLAPENPPAGPAEQADTPDIPSAAPTRQGTGETDYALIIRNRVIDEAPTKPANGRKAFLARQLIAAGQHGVSTALVVNGAEEYVPLEDLIQAAIKAAA